MKTLVWVCTTSCNLHCGYCHKWWGKASGIHNCSPETVVAAFKRLPGLQRVDITGGEPCLVSNLDRVIVTLAPLEVAITTNATLPLDRFVTTIPPERLVALTLSWHPSGPLSADMFAGKFLFLEKRGYNPRINFVLAPEQLWMARKYKAYFDSIVPGRFHVDPCWMPVDWRWSGAERVEIAELCKGTDRRHLMRLGADSTVERVVCTAGVDNMLVMPDGAAYRCVEDVVDGAPSLGNVFRDAAFALPHGQVECDRMDRCSGCDWDKTTRRGITA